VPPHRSQATAIAMTTSACHSSPGRRLAPRLAIGGLAHETNSFSPVPTTLDAFRRRSYLTGESLVRQSRIGRGVFGGIVDTAETAGATLLPTLFASAPPGGIVARDAFDALRYGLLDRLRAHRRGPWPLDGVVLALHGAMAAEGEDDCEGAVLTDVRELIGREVPLVAVVDSHANVSARMVAACDLLLSYDTYPHLDPYERGQEAVARCLDVRRHRIAPVAVLRRLPLLAPLPPQRTDGETPFAAAMALVHALEAEPGVVAIALAGGFPYADTARTGVSVTVTTDGDARRAGDLANRVAAAIWDRRDDLRADGVTPDEAIDRALAVPDERTVVLADVADNPGAGAPGDGTWLLSRLIERGVRGAAVAALPDPAAVAAAIAAGVGGRVRVALGGKIDARGGPPLDVTATVEALGDGVFSNLGPMGRGAPTRLGRTATLAVGGVEVVVCERPVQAADPGLFLAAGIDPSARRILAVKSGVHFRAAFAPLAGAIVEVEAGGVSSSDLTRFPYRRLRRPIAPLDDGVRSLD
jgi:microcystin degradation protein MlrC